MVSSGGTMHKPNYTAGLRFIVSGPDLTLTPQDRKNIRSHPKRARGKRRKTIQLQSWINPDRSLGLAKETRSQESQCFSTTILNNIGGFFAGLDLAPGIEPATIQDLVQLISIDREGAYPYDICLQVHPVERGWFPYMASDICCIHSMMFSLRTWMDQASHGGQLSRQAAFHYARTLRILQARVTAFRQGQPDLVFCDSTIMAIIFLATTAEFMGDFTAVQTHVDGLLEIVSLKGGVRSLKASNNMQVKVCRFVQTLVSDHRRADLGIALRSGSHARLFRNDIVWDCFIADRGAIRCNHEPHASEIVAFVDDLDTKLGNCWKDLHAFSCMSNLAYQTTRKLSPETYCEIMISIVYRLMHLSFEENSVQDAIRIGLLAFSSTIFLTSFHIDRPYKHLFKLFGDRLFKLCHTTSITVPQPLILWLLILYHVVAYQQPFPVAWQNACLRKTILRCKLVTWSHTQGILRSIMWVGFVHDAPGRKVFEAAVQHIQRENMDIRQEQDDLSKANASFFSAVVLVLETGCAVSAIVSLAQNMIWPEESLYVEESKVEGGETMAASSHDIEECPGKPLK